MKGLSRWRTASSESGEQVLRLLECILTQGGKPHAGEQARHMVERAGLAEPVDGSAQVGQRVVDPFGAAGETAEREPDQCRVAGLLGVRQRRLGGLERPAALSLASNSPSRHGSGTPPMPRSSPRMR